MNTNLTVFPDNNLQEALLWRYATKRMNGQKVPAEKIERILEAARLAPSAVGLQPYQILVISDPEFLKKVQPIANNQPQITEASHLLVLAAWDDLNAGQIDKVFDHIQLERNLPEGAMDDYRNRLKNSFGSKTREERFQYAAKQAYISLGFALVAAALEKVDATPMEGFRNAELDQLLGLQDLGLKSVALVALGYRDEANDWLLKQKKVRKPKEEFVVEIN